MLVFLPSPFLAPSAPVINPQAPNSATGSSVRVCWSLFSDDTVESYQLSYRPVRDGSPGTDPAGEALPGAATLQMAPPQRPGPAFLAVRGGEGMNLLTQPLEQSPSGNYPEDVMPAGEQVERALKASRGLTGGTTGQADVSGGHLHGAVSIALGTRL